MKIVNGVSCASFAVALAGSSFHSADQVLTDGLKIWRKPGVIQDGAACATCHSPDGIELAAYDFDDADITRRARPHLSAEDTEALLGYIHALRAKHRFNKLRDPNRERPLQPGGEVLPGKTAAERDLAFGFELQDKLPLLFNARIGTYEQAKAAEQQLLDLSPNQLRIGIPLNPLSEDVAHGNEHSSIAQWLPEIAPPVTGDDLAKWYAAEDEYLANPSDAALHKMLLLHSQLANTNRMMGLAALSTFKYRALLVLQDRIRRHQESPNGNVSTDVQAYGNFNPVWQVGEFARQMMDRPPVAVGMDPSLQKTKLAGPAFKDQLHQMRVAWFWAGWLSDQGLFKSSHEDKTRFGLWMSESLSKDGPYAFHNIYANARRQAVVSNDPAAWGEPLDRKRRIWDFAGLRSFRQYITDIPADSKAKNLYIRFTDNCFRMNLLLLEHDIATSGEVWIKANTIANATELIDFTKEQDPTNASADQAVLARITTLATQAQERR